MASTFSRNVIATLLMSFTERSNVMASSARATEWVVREAEVGLITPTFEHIALRAYQIGRREGEVQGKDRDHWLQAVAELTHKTRTDEEEDDDDDDEDEQDDAAVSDQKWPRSSGRIPLPQNITRP
jgi:hypothetical protein